MNTKSKRQYDRSRHSARVPRHYSRLINDTPAVKIGLGIVGILVLFLGLVILSALVR